MTEPTVREKPGQRVSWFELFYDLIIVAAVGHGSEIFSESPTWRTGIVVALSVTVLFAAWLLTTLNHGVFPGEDPLRRGLVLLQMLALTVAALSIGPHELPTDTGFYALALVLGAICATWAVSRRLRPDGTALTRPVVAGTALGALLLVIAGLLPGEGPFVRSAAALAVVAAVLPLVTVFLSRAVRDGFLDSHHLEERLGLLVLIVLGESFAHLIGSLAGLGEIPNLPFFVLTFLVVFAIWLLYFSSVAEAGLPETAARLRGWLAAHLLLTFGAVAVAASFADLTLVPPGSGASTTQGNWTSLPMAYVVIALAILAALSGAQRAIVRAHLVTIGVLLALAIADIVVWDSEARSATALGALVLLADAAVVSAIRRRAGGG